MSLPLNLIVVPAERLEDEVLAVAGRVAGVLKLHLRRLDRGRHEDVTQHLLDRVALHVPEVPDAVLDRRPQAEADPRPKVYITVAGRSNALSLLRTTGDWSHHCWNHWSRTGLILFAYVGRGLFERHRIVAECDKKKPADNGE